MRLGYDSITPTAIPTTAAVVLGYVPPSGYAWTAAGWARFPNSVHVTITTSASAAADVLDVERGAASAIDAPGWITRMRALGVNAVVYCSASTWQSVQDEFHAAHVTQPPYWIAAYPGGGPTLPTLNGIQAIAHQYADPTTSGGHYDLSVIADGFWTGEPTVEWTDPLPFPQAGANVTAPAEQMLANADYYSGVSMNNTSTLLAKFDQLTATVASLVATVAAIQTTVNSVTPNQLTGTANVTIQLEPPTVTEGEGINPVTLSEPPQ